MQAYKSIQHCECIPLSIVAQDVVYFLKVVRQVSTEKDPVTYRSTQSLPALYKNASSQRECFNYSMSCFISSRLKGTLKAEESELT